MQLAVLNPGGSDPNQLFPDGAGVPGAPGHAPINYHAYAACTKGGFFRDIENVPCTMPAVLLLLRKDLRPALVALRKLLTAGRTVAVSWKESGPYQIARQLETPGAQALFAAICREADGALASTPEAEIFYREAGAKTVEYIPTPYPVDDARWDFGCPLAERSGIFIGTREWSEPTRRHEEAVNQALGLGIPVTVVNDGSWVRRWKGRNRLRKLGISSERILSRMDYPRYLEAMARCRVVFQRDSSAVPGQIAGDALLCRMPCVGGNGAVDREAFGHPAEAETLRALLTDDAAWRKAVEDSQERARQRLGFPAVSMRLRDFFAGIAK